MNVFWIISLSCLGAVIVGGIISRTIINVRGKTFGKETAKIMMFWFGLAAVSSFVSGTIAVIVTLIREVKA